MWIWSALAGTAAHSVFVRFSGSGATPNRLAWFGGSDQKRDCFLRLAIASPHLTFFAIIPKSGCRRFA